MPQLKIWQANVLSNIMQRVWSLAYYYSRQATKCTDLTCTSFLVYVAYQKARQIAMLQERAGIYEMDIFTKSKIGNQDLGDVSENLSDKSLDELFNYIKKLSVRDLKMYTFLSQEDKKFKSILFALIGFEKNFMANIKSGYLNQVSTSVAGENKTLEVESGNKVLQHA
jgi:hypothetical protein